MVLSPNQNRPDGGDTKGIDPGTAEGTPFLVWLANSVLMLRLDLAPGVSPTVATPILGDKRMVRRVLLPGGGHYFAITNQETFTSWQLFVESGLHTGANGDVASVVASMACF